MWKVLANKYRDDLAFANHRDRDGKASATLGYDVATQKESKILVYPAGSAMPFLFEGTYRPSPHTLAPLVIIQMTVQV
jgi:protein disulfide-isomerase A6